MSDNGDEITIDWDPGDGFLGERKVKVDWIEFSPMGEDETWAPVLDPTQFGTLDDLEKKETSEEA